MKHIRSFLIIMIVIFISSTALARPPEMNHRECFANDGRFCKYMDGTVMDMSSGLMWAARDNGSDIDWLGAKYYCDNYRGGGYMDWRMPTQDELASLYDPGRPRPSPCSYNFFINLTGMIDLSCTFVWAFEAREAAAANFDFSSGQRVWNYQSYFGFLRALPVRSGR
ncbi:MAG: DUF1566 domain-containing protein [Syntrophus sp. (in: bacteria)]